MKVVILNVKYSPNLGDGVIAECLESQLKTNDSELEVVSLDIGGMSGFQQGGSILGSKLSIMRLVKKLPQPIKKILFRWLMPIVIYFKYRKLWSDVVSDADALIIGGGHLFMDVDHYFPMRLKVASSFAKFNTPIFVHSVGVSKKMSVGGNKMFVSIFENCKLYWASVRDENSFVNWKKNFNLLDPVICRDPGLLSFKTYNFNNVRNQRDEQLKVIGLGVSDPASMVPHSDSSEGVVCGEISFYIEAIKSLTKYYEVKVFTNGEDYEFLGRVEQAIAHLPINIKDKVQVLPRPTIPKQLVEIIVGCDLIIAHRLHANIISYSYQIPHIGLGWDDKLKSFFKYIDREEFLIIKNLENSEALLAKVKKAYAVGINQNTHSKIIDDSSLGITTLYNEIKSSINTEAKSS